MRRFNPIQNTESEHKFLDAAERLFFKGSQMQLACSSIGAKYRVGWQLGSEPEVQVPNNVSNHLTSGLLHYINTTGRYTSGINLFEKLRTRDVEVSSLLARILIAADEEVRAVSLLHETVQELPMDYSLLDVQASFLQSKGRGELALECAKRGVIAAPSEFGTWARLAEIYVHAEEWELALLTLNSCPMFTYQDKDGPRMPEPARVSLPVLPESLLDEINDDSAGEMDIVHLTLRKLPAANYRGTFLKAYSLLTEITEKIGWDQLLKIRSRVFVMEEEYRSEKQGSQQAHSRNASTTALRVPSPNPVENGDAPAAADADSALNEDEDPNGLSASEGDERGDTASDVVKDEKREKSMTLSPDDAVEKPEHTVSSQEVKSGSEDASIS